MGLDVDLERDIHFQGPRPKIVHPPFRSRSKVEVREIKGQPTSRDYHFNSSDVEFRGLNFSLSPSPHRKSMPARPPRHKVEVNAEPKRGSAYQSSSEVRSMRKLKEGRMKVSTYSDEAFLSFDIVDSSSRNRRDNSIVLSQQKRPELGSLTTESKSSHVDTFQLIPTKNIELLDLSFRDLPDKQRNFSNSCSSCVMPTNYLSESLMEASLQRNGSGSPSAKETPDFVERSHIEESTLGHYERLCLKNAGNTPHGIGIMHNHPNSCLTKVGMFDSPCQSERETVKASPKTRFSSLKKMLDPIMKSKSLRNSSNMEAEVAVNSSTDPSSVSSNGYFHNYLLNDLSKGTQKMEYDKQLFVNYQVSSAVFSAAHMHAVLKLESKNGTPSFEFAVKDSEDFFSAKTWGTDSAFNWAYTFHSCRRKNSSTGNGTKGRHGQSQMVGQMQVSCFLCSDMNENGSLSNCMVTEFILYDIDQVRRNSAVEGISHSPPCPTQLPAVTVSESLAAPSSLDTNSSLYTEKYQNTYRRTCSDRDSIPSTSYPWSPVNLHSHLEIAAISVQIPLKKESLKDVQGKEINNKDGQKTTSFSTTDHEKYASYSCRNPAVVKVVTPSGKHGLPNSEEGEPSSLLDRWKFGGGCDCGGWDMACPLVVFDCPCADDLVDCSTVGSQRPMLLFFQGLKDKVPALSITAEGEGRYSVDFHAHLSALQAFSIVIAVLHISEASAVGHDRDNSLKLLLGEQVKRLIEAVTEEKVKEKAKAKATKRTGHPISSSFLLDPPFSPMGRV